MNAIPWYQSPLFIGLAISIAGQLVNAFGLAGSITEADIEKGVNGFFAIAALISTVVASIVRWRSKIQPLALTKHGAETKTAIQSGKIPLQKGFARISLLFGMWLMMLGGLAFLAACVTTPVDVIKLACARDASYEVTRCAKSIGDVYESYQKRVAEVVANPTTPAEVKDKLKQFDREATPAVVEVLRSSRTYKAIAAEIKAGATQEEQLAIANANLERYITEALPRLYALIDAFGG